MTLTRFETSLGVITAIGLGYLVYDFAVPAERPIQALSGEIRIEGRPMHRGTVRFISLEPDKPWAFGGFVSNGRYEVPLEFGLPLARYHVEFSSIRNDELDAMMKARSRGEEVVLTEQVPARFNLNSNVELDLSEGTVLVADFDLK